MKILMSCLVLILSLPIDTYSQELSVGGILYGPNWGCLVKAPAGWSMDQTSLAKYHIYGLFYEDGKKFGGSTPIIYINTSKLNDSSDEELSKYIKWDLGNYEKNGAVVKKLSKSYAHFSNLNESYTIDQKNGQLETVVYTRYKDGAFLIILNAKDQETRLKLQKQLDEVVDNMGFMEKND